MQHQVGVGDLLERGPEGLHQLMRQVPDEADRVGEGVDPAVGVSRAAHGGVEGGEQRVLHQHPGAGQPVQQRRLPGVGVPGDRHRRHRVAPRAGRAASRARSHPGRSRRAACEIRVADPPPVGLDLGLAGTAGADAAAAGDPATGLPGQRLAPAAQPRQHVLQLGELDLGLALPAPGVLGEDVQDQRGPVDDLDLDHAPPACASWLGRQLAVADDGVGAGRRHDLAQLHGLARADVGGRVRLAAALDEAVEHHANPRSRRAAASSRQRVLRARSACRRSRPRPAPPAPGAGCGIRLRLRR